MRSPLPSSCLSSLRIMPITVPVTSETTQCFIYLFIRSNILIISGIKSKKHEACCIINSFSDLKQRGVSRLSDSGWKRRADEKEGKDSNRQQLWWKAPPYPTQRQHCYVRPTWHLSPSLCHVSTVSLERELQDILLQHAVFMSCKASYTRDTVTEKSVRLQFQRVSVSMSHLLTTLFLQFKLCLP